MTIERNWETESKCLDYYFSIEHVCIIDTMIHYKLYSALHDVMKYIRNRPYRDREGNFLFWNGSGHGQNETKTQALRQHREFSFEHGS